MKTQEHDLTGKKIAILATDGFEQDELLSPMEALKAAHADVKVVSLTENEIRGWKPTWRFLKPVRTSWKDSNVWRKNSNWVPLN
jgi:protease I